MKENYPKNNFNQGSLIGLNFDNPTGGFSRSVVLDWASFFAERVQFSRGADKRKVRSGPRGNRRPRGER